LAAYRLDGCTSIESSFGRRASFVPTLPEVFLMSRYLPIALGVLTIVVLTFFQIRMTDRFADTNVTTVQRAELLQNIPKTIGNWIGEDMAVDETVRDTAGAIGAISRVYRNVRTGETVDLWLIVGHGRAISAHTPNICYRASGFEMRAAESSLYPMVFEGQPEAPFLTNTFFKEDVTGRRLVRVFWSWYNADEDKDPTTVEWEAPTNSRWYFGNTRALYKMYFTSEMRDPTETAEQSSCLRFASEFMPVVNKALAVVYGDAEPAKAADTEAAATDDADVQTDNGKKTGDAADESDTADAVTAKSADASDSESDTPNAEK
jgi:hypothetical protein